MSIYNASSNASYEITASEEKSLSNNHILALLAMVLLSCLCLLLVNRKKGIDQLASSFVNMFVCLAATMCFNSMAIEKKIGFDQNVLDEKIIFLLFWSVYLYFLLFSINQISTFWIFTLVFILRL
jgi:hypothetical protein